MTKNTCRAEVWANCGHCGHTWIVYGTLPAPLEIVCKAMTRAACPCCSITPKKIYMAKETDILAALSKSNAVSPPDGGAGEPPSPPSSPAPTLSPTEDIGT